MDTETIIRILKQYPIAIIFGILSIVLIFLISSFGDQIPALDNELKGISKKLADIDKKQRDTVGISSDIESARVLASQLSERMMDRRADLDHQFFLFNLYDKSGFRTRQPDPGKLLRPNRSQTDTILFPQLQFQTTVSGSFENCLGLLFNIQHSEHLMVVDSVTMIPIDNPNARRVKMTVVFRSLAEK